MRIGVGLSIPELATRGGRFSPASLFTGGVQGAWYDPSDYSTLFQDSSGTTPVTAVEQPVGLMRDKSGNNNHASQATATSRPVLRARYNLLTYSEQFDNAAWTKTNATVTANATTAPDGTSTADFLVETAATGSHQIVSNVNPISGVTYVSSFYAKANGRNWVAFYTSSASGGAGRFAYFDLVNGAVGTVQSPLTASIQSVGNGWYRCSVTFTTNSSNELSAIIIASANGVVSYAGDITKGVFIWGAQAVPTAVFPSNTYQRIAAATDYDTAGFLPYLAFDGSDDSLLTGNINFTTTDKVTVWAGVTKLGDATTAALFELGDTSVSSASFSMLAPLITTPSSYSFGSYGSTSLLRATAGGYPAPVTSVLAGQADISGDLVTLRVNGAELARNISDQGTGNYGNYPLFIGRRNNASLPFNGRLYSLIVAGKTVSASELASTEAYVAAKTGVTL